jgi:outer membrane protein assembly factor BamB
MQTFELVYRVIIRKVRPLSVCAILASCLPGASTATWELNSWQDFVKGKFTNVALSRDGRLAAAPALTQWADTSQPAVWSAAPAKDGGFYLGTGHRGHVYYVDKAGQATSLWTAPEPEVFAIATDTKGTLYAATSPDGKVYRLDTTTKPAKATMVFDPKSRYIWSLAVGVDGTLYIGTGDQGRVYAFRNNTGEVWYETGQAHVTSLTLDSQGRLLAGTEPNGILLRVTGKNKAFVQYDSSLPEIRAIAVGGDGAIYAAGLGGAVAKRTAGVGAAGAAGAAGAVAVQGTTLTVTDSAAVQAGMDAKPKGTASSSFSATTTTPVVATMEVAGVEKSAIYKISADNTVDTLWSSKEENIFDLYELAGEITFATDVQGRIYRFDKEKRLSLLGQTQEGEVTRLIAAQDQVLATTSNVGRLYKLAPSSAAGVYESPVHDANTVARWGKLAMRGTGAVKLFTRSGNSGRPDRTWSDWEAPGEAQQVASPNARFLQFKAEFANGAGVEALRLAYLPQNTPPVVKSISVVGQTVASTATTTRTGTTATSGASAIYSITVTDTGEASTPSTGTPTQTVTRTASRQLVVSWTAEDPDADPLLYSLHYRGEGEKKWKMLRANTAEMAVVVDSEIFADGRYLLRVTASDKSANAAESAREAELVSAPVLVDNTPPAITAPKRTGNQVEVTATDATSELKRCEYSLDAGVWTLLEAADGVTDSMSETFALALPKLAEGEHVLVFRVTDVAGNVALRKILVEP